MYLKRRLPLAEKYPNLIVLCIFIVLILYTMLLTKEIYREEYFQQTKKIFYNDKQQMTGTLEISKANGEEHGLLSVHEYTGENHRLVKYNGQTKTYAHFVSRGPAVL